MVLLLPFLHAYQYGFVAVCFLEQAAKGTAPSEIRGTDGWDTEDWGSLEEELPQVNNFYESNKYKNILLCIYKR